MQTPTHESGRLARERERTVTCPRCGTVNDTDARWCIHCAVRLGPAAITEPARLPTPTRSKWPFRAAAAAAVVFILISGLYSVMVFAPRVSPLHLGATNRDSAQTAREIETVGTRFVGYLLTYNHRTLQADLSRLRRYISPSFPRQFHTALSGDLTTYIARIARNHAVSTGDVKGLVITSRDADTATALALVSQTVHSDNVLPDTRLLALELTLVKLSSGWKVDNVANAANPSG